jgi:GNAT superfamily N-acetyltransferase
MNIEVRKLTPELAEDYARFFDKTPHWGNDDTKCYCITWCGDNVYNNGGKHWFQSPDERRSNAIKRVQNGDIQGYLAYNDNNILGWCNANTKADCRECINYLRTDGGVPLQESLVGEKVKFIFCFVINPKMLRMGIATKLLEYVCQDATIEGYDFVEAFPNKKIIDAYRDHRGPLTMYEKYGFIKYAEKNGIVVVRKVLK